jgi:hypothetical protein
MSAALDIGALALLVCVAANGQRNLRGILTRAALAFACLVIFRGLRIYSLLAALIGLGLTRRISRRQLVVLGGTALVIVAWWPHLASTPHGFWTLSALALLAFNLPASALPNLRSATEFHVSLGVALLLALLGVGLSYTIGTAVFVFALWRFFLHRALLDLERHFLGPQTVIQ